MSYGNLYEKKPIRIPSVLGVVMVAAVSFLVMNFFLTDPQSTKAVKKNIILLDVANISSSKSNIVWRTSEQELGVVIYGVSEKKLSNIAIDERDSTNARQKYFNHSVSLNNLLPNTEYFYSITNEKELFSINDSTAFKFKTAPIDNRINSLKPAYGTVISSTGAPEPNALIILRHEGSVPLSTISKSSGEWLMPLNGLLASDTLALSTPALSSKVTIQLYDEKGNTSSLTAPIQLSSPISDSIRMGENYSLPEDSAVLGTSTLVGNSSSSNNNLKSKSFSVIYPISDSVLPIGNPLIKGMGLPLTTVTISVRSLDNNTATISKQTTVDSKGEWKITLSQPLSAGIYRLVVKSSQATEAAVTREFTVTKSGERVLGEATGSADLSPTSTPSATPSAAPVITAEPTEITPTLPATGGSISYLMYSSAALIVLGLGLMFVF